MSGISQGPPPAGPANATRIELEVYDAGRPRTEMVQTTVASALQAFGLEPGALQVAGHYDEVMDRSRVQILGTLKAAVLSREELLAAVAPVTANLRVDAQVWPVHLP